ncbi:MAG: DUF2721 domain-containing protein [Gammaproteobacteria bacterium]
MNSLTTLSDIAHIIELAIAPVFLLASIAGFLAVMSGRLARIVDRSRVLRELKTTSAREEHTVIWQRLANINLAIGFCTTAGLLVCLLIVSLFLGGLLAVNVGSIISGLFVLSMLALVVALMLFLKEVRLTTRTIQIVKKTPSDFKND